MRSLRFFFSLAGSTLVLGLSFWLSPTSLAGPADAGLLPEESWQLLVGELSGAKAKEHVVEIVRHHRVQGSRGYSSAARYVLTQLRGFGYPSAKSWIESFKSDGIVRYQTWQSPSGWSIDSASLRMIEPRSELITRYPDIPMSVVTYSNSGTVRAELIDVGKGTSPSDYEGKDVRGKLVLASGYGGAVHRLAVIQHGAAGVICYLDDSRAEHHPDMTGYTGMWPRTEELPYVTLGFNLSNRHGLRLKQLLASGQRVVLDAQINGAGLEPGQMDVVVAEITGTNPEPGELIFIAHLDHPGQSANDNASGSAALLDIARTFQKLIAEKKIEPPRHTLRFLWVPEFFGTMAYLDAHPELKGPTLGGRTLAAINLDMVGEDLRQIQTRLNIILPPVTMSSALVDVVEQVTHRVDEAESEMASEARSSFNYRITPFSGGSDHVVFNDGAVAVPSVMLGHWPDYTHHTSEDTPDKVDPVELERCELIAAASLWTLARLNESQALRLTGLVSAAAQSQLVKDTERAAGRLLEAPADEIQRFYQQAKDSIDFSLQRELQRLESVLAFADYPAVAQFVERSRQSLQGQAGLQRRTLLAVFQQRARRFPMPLQQNESEQEAARWIPKRRTRGPLSGGLPESELSEEEQQWYRTDAARALDRYLLINLIDGQRSILDLRDDLAAAAEPVPLDTIDRFVRDLAKAGVVELDRH